VKLDTGTHGVDTWERLWIELLKLHIFGL